MIRHSLIALLLLAAAMPARGGEEGILLGKTQTVRVTGTVVDAKTGRPLENAQVAIETPYETRRGDTGPDGTFLVTATSADGLGNVSVVFSHPDYQQKYFETVLRDALRGHIDLAVTNGHVQVKARKVNVDLACGKSTDVQAKEGVATVTTVCDGGISGVAVGLRGNRIAVLADGPFTVRVEDGRVVVRDSQNTTLDVRIDAAMQPR